MIERSRRKGEFTGLRYSFPETLNNKGFRSICPNSLKTPIVLESWSKMTHPSENLTVLLKIDLNELLSDGQYSGEIPLGLKSR
jgi:hypothetical protein